MSSRNNVTQASNVIDKIKLLYDRFMCDLVADGWDPYNEDSHTLLMVLQMELEGYYLYGNEEENGRWEVRFYYDDIWLPHGSCYSFDLLEAICDAAIVIINMEVGILVTAVLTKKICGEDNFIMDMAKAVLRRG